MFIKINDMYFNANEMNHIGIFESLEQTKYVLGITVNQTNYAIYTAKIEDGKINKQARDIMVDCVHKIIDEILKDVEIKEIQVPIPFEQSNTEDNNVE